MTRKSPAAPAVRATIVSFFPEEEELLPGLSLRLARPPAAAAACLALLDLADLAGKMTGPQDEQDLTGLLSPTEQARFAALTFPKRRREWLGGRLAGKCAVLQLAPPPAPVALPALSIPAAANGAPCLSCPSLPEWRLPAISLSHSDRYAVAMAARARTCGIDLQNTTPQILRVADRFTQPAEIELLRETLPELTEMERLTLLWTAKEALKKGLLSDQPAIFQGVTLQAVRRGACLTLGLRYPDDGGVPAAVRAVALDGHFLAYTIAPPHA